MKTTFATRGLVLAAVAALSLTVACSSKEKEVQPVVTVQTAVAERGPIQQVIRSEAVLYPRDQAAITPKVTAPVRTFYVNRGSRVRKGELLAVLENRDIAASMVENKGAYEQAEAAYKTATSASLPEEMQKAELDVKSSRQALDANRKVYESRQSLYKQGAIPRKDLDQSAVTLVQSRAQYEIAEKHLQALKSIGHREQLKSAQGQLTSAKGKFQGAEAMLSYTEIRSPINGYVTDRPLYPGETPAPGAPLLTVMDTSSVIARAHIPAEDAALLHRGDPATIISPGNIRVAARVTVISPAVDPNSTTVEVWVEAPNTDGRLRPGTTVTAEMVARTVKDAVIVPVEAVLKSSDNATTIMTVGSDNHAHEVSVTTGIRDGDRIQITSGLKGGETVITVGAYGIPDNTEVKVSNPSNNAAAKPEGN